jgi:CHAD domain-containing protein
MKRGEHALTPYAGKQTADRLEKFEVHLDRVRRHSKDPESIHDLRVSIRRLRQCLDVFDGLFRPKRVRQMRRKLRRLMDHSAAVRDFDIGLEVLGSSHASATLVRSFRRRRSQADRDLRALLEKWKTKNATRKWKDWLKPAPSRGTAAMQARRVLPVLARELFQEGARSARPGTSARRIHRFRLLTKRFRYALETFEPVYGGGLEQGLETLRALQDRLGAISDCWSTLELLEKGTVARAEVQKIQKERVEEFRGYWKVSFSRKYQQWWINKLRTRRTEK